MPPLLELDRVVARYGRVQVLHGVSLVVPRRSVVALLGPNGVGKTTTLRVVSGMLPVARGEVRLDGKLVSGLSAYGMARRGVTLVPEGRGIFPSLTVEENLDVASRATPGLSPAQRRARVDEVLERFPVLAPRRKQRAATMSGGEQQMLSLGRAFLSDAQLLLLDEISMGLAPMVVAGLFEGVAALRDQGKTILMVEQFLTYALRLADLCYVMAKGKITFVGDPGELRTNGHRMLGG